MVQLIDPHEFTRMKSLTNIDSKDLMIQTFVAKHYNKEVLIEKFSRLAARNQTSQTFTERFPSFVANIVTNRNNCNESRMRRC